MASRPSGLPRLAGRPLPAVRRADEPTASLIWNWIYGTRLGVFKLSSFKYQLAAR